MAIGVRRPADADHRVRLDADQLDQALADHRIRARAQQRRPRFEQMQVRVHQLDVGRRAERRRVAGRRRAPIGGEVLAVAAVHGVVRLGVDQAEGLQREGQRVLVAGRQRVLADRVDREGLAVEMLLRPHHLPAGDVDLPVEAAVRLVPHDVAQEAIAVIGRLAQAGDRVAAAQQGRGQPQLPALRDDHLDAARQRLALRAVVDRVAAVDRVDAAREPERDTFSRRFCSMRGVSARTRSTVGAAPRTRAAPALAPASGRTRRRRSSQHGGVVARSRVSCVMASLARSRPVPARPSGAGSSPGSAR